MEFKGSAEFAEFWGYLKDESPRCVAIVAATYFDERLGSLVDPAKKKCFDDRIKSALLQQFICVYESDDLHIIRKLRNSFAHNLRATDFDEEKTKQVNSMQTWAKASNAWQIYTEYFPTARERLLYVASVFYCRLNNRNGGTVPPNFDPEVWRSNSWPPVTNV
jgi:hypothetical protein